MLIYFSRFKIVCFKNIYVYVIDFVCEVISFVRLINRHCVSACVWLVDLSHIHYSASYWVRWRLKLPATRLLIQPFVQAQMKEAIKALHQWPLWRELTRDRLISRTKGQYFNLMTSSWYHCLNLIVMNTICKDPYGHRQLTPFTYQAVIKSNLGPINLLKDSVTKWRLTAMICTHLSTHVTMIS